MLNMKMNLQNFVSKENSALRHINKIRKKSVLSYILFFKSKLNIYYLTVKKFMCIAVVANVVLSLFGY